MTSRLFLVSRIFGCFAAAIILSGAAFGQTVSGTLRGTVTDSNGAVVPNATVIARNTETGRERTVTTSDDGLYNIPFLPIGQYTVEASRTDFNKVNRENVTISLNETTVLDVRLDPSVSGEVTVTAEPPPINSTNAEVGGTLSAQQIAERPVANQTNFLTLAETFTGFQENPTSGQNNPTLSSGSSINFNGTGTRGATFQIGGISNDDSSENQNRQGVALAAIKEFKVLTNNYSAEFGRGFGAVVLAQPENGTNSLKGQVYWFHNDSALNAKRMNSHGNKPVARRNQFGGVVGFPIVKDRFFAFLSVDRLENTGANLYTRDVFLPSERNSASWFQTTQGMPNDTPANRAFIQSVIDRFANVMPNSTLGPRVFQGEQGFDFPAEDYSARFDWNPTDADSLWARYQYSRQQFTADDIIIGERADQNNKQQNWALDWVHTFTPNLVGEFRYGLGLRTTLVNIAAGNDTPVIRFQNPVAFGGSIIGNAGAYPIQRYQTDHQFVYNVAHSVGRHIFKSGIDFYIRNLDDLADNFSRGFYTFNQSCDNGTEVYLTGFQALINGCVANFQKGYGPFYLQNRLGETNLYAEDTWRITPKLTLTLGARYEYVNAPRDTDGLVEYGFGDDKDNVEPRVGFALGLGSDDGFLRTLFGKSGDSSVRGGYGIFHGRLFQSVFSQSGATLRFNPPNAFFYNQSGAGTSIFNPNNLSDPTNGFVFVPGPQTARHSLTLTDPNLEMPYTQQWNLTFERALAWKSALRLTYSGNRGIGLPKFTLQNLAVHDPNGVLVANHPNNPANLRGQMIFPAADVFCAGTNGSTIPFTDQCPNAVGIGTFEYSLRVPRVNERRPDPRYSTNILINNGAWTYYNAFQAEFTKRLSNSLNFQAAYTWSKAIDTLSEATFVGAGDSNQNGNDAEQNRGYSRFHTPHRFTFFGTYRNPFFDKDRGVLGYILGGWEMSAVFKWSHGTPFTVSGTGFDLDLDGFAETRPVLLDPSILGRTIGNPATAQQDLPISAFAIPTSVNQQDCCLLGRNTFFLDGQRNVDLAFSKRFRMPWEGHSLAVRADLFNAFNKVQWGFPNVTYTTTINVPGLGNRLRPNPALGTITPVTFATSYQPRNIQVSLKYFF